MQKFSNDSFIICWHRENPGSSLIPCQKYKQKIRCTLSQTKVQTLWECLPRSKHRLGHAPQEPRKKDNNIPLHIFIDVSIFPRPSYFIRTTFRELWLWWILVLLESFFIHSLLHISSSEKTCEFYHRIELVITVFIPSAWLRRWKCG